MASYNRGMGLLSASGAVVHGDWVSSHDRLGRNRP